MTFVHSGDAGDCLYSMPVIRAKGGGVLYLRASNFTRVPMTRQHAQALIPLLEAQPYIESVREWNGENCDVDLDIFRDAYFKALRKDINKYRSTSLAYWYSQVFGTPESEWQTPWLEVQENDAVPYASPVVINRSPRYHNPRFPWDKVFEKYSGEWKQIGHLSEMFANSGTFRKTADLLEAAQVINDAQLFIGNQSACLAICEGLKKPCVVEIYPEMPNTLFYREHCWHGWNENVYLPDLKDLP